MIPRGFMSSLWNGEVECDKEELWIGEPERAGGWLEQTRYHTIHHSFWYDEWSGCSQMPLTCERRLTWHTRHVDCTKSWKKYKKTAVGGILLFSNTSVSNCTQHIINFLLTEEYLRSLKYLKVKLTNFRAELLEYIQILYRVWVNIFFLKNPMDFKVSNGGQFEKGNFWSEMSSSYWNRIQ